MWGFDKRALWGASLIICLTSGCCAQRGVRHVNQCGQGHSSLLEWAMSRSGSRCDSGPCNDGCYQGTAPVAPQSTPPTPPAAQPPGESSPDVAPPPPRQVLRPERHESAQLRPNLRRRILNKLPDGSWFSIPLPKDVFSIRTSTSADAPDEIPWDGPVAVRTEEALSETTEVVDYEYESRQPVELQAPEIAGTPRTLPVATEDADSGHSMFHHR